MRAPAKINPVLEVLHQRPDGYHELALVFQAVTLYDDLFLEKIPSGVEFSLDPPVTGLGPADSSLVVKASRLYFEEILGERGGVRAVLTKGIPLAAGLGGGSSDAAAALVGLEALYQTGCGMEKLRSIASKVGSDVAFFLNGGTALGTGRGEIIESWQPGPAWNLVLVKPPEGLSTPLVYRSGKANLTDGARARAFRETARKAEPREISASLYNGLEEAAISLLPSIRKIKDEMMALGAWGTLVSGSGPTVFGIVDNKARAMELARNFQREGWTSQAVTTTSSGAEAL
jgi:4-diphosphocytidyl-2-C-methyl-D-erythritol kinase